MNDIATQQRFVQLRSQGCSFARIADELNVSKPTLIKWSRKFQYEIQNLRAVELEALQQKIVDDGLANMAKTKPTMRLYLTEKDLAELGLKQVGGKLTGRVTPAALAAKSRLIPTEAKLLGKAFEQRVMAHLIDCARQQTLQNSDLVYPPCCR